MDKGGSCVALLTNLCKAFDCIVNDGFSYEALKVAHSYVTDRKHRTKIKNFFSNFIGFLVGISQDSILGPLLFNIYIYDIFFFIEENVTSYADHTTPYSNGDNVVTVLEDRKTKGKSLTGFQ